MTTPAANAEQSNPTQAVEVAKPQTQTGLVTRDLFNVAAFDNSPELSKVFGLKPVNSKGVVVGGSFEMIKKSEVSKALGLKGDALNDKVREARAEAMTAVKKHIAGLSADWVLHKFATRVLSDGTKQQTMVTREMPVATRAQFVKYAMAMGYTEDEAEEMCNKKTQPAVNVETTVTATQEAPKAPAKK